MRCPSLVLAALVFVAANPSPLEAQVVTESGSTPGSPPARVAAHSEEETDRRIDSVVAIAEGLFAFDDATAAAKAFMRSTELDPRSRRGRLFLAQTHVRLGAFDEAAREFREVGGPDPVICGLQAALALVAAGNWKESAKLLAEYQANSSDNPCFVFVPTNMDDAEATHAIVHWKEAIEGDPRSALPHWFLGMALDRAGRLDESTEMLEKARTLSPNWTPVSIALAVAKLDKGLPDDAVKLVDQVLAEQPDHVAARFLRLQANRRKRDLAAAATDGRYLASRTGSRSMPMTIRLAATTAFEAGAFDEAARLIDQANLEVLSPEGFASFTLPFPSAAESLAFLSSAEVDSEHRQSDVGQYFFSTAMTMRAEEILQKLPTSAIDKVFASSQHQELADELDRLAGPSGEGKTDERRDFTGEVARPKPVRPRIVAHLAGCADRLRAAISRNSTFLSLRVSLALVLQDLSDELGDPKLRKESNEHLLEVLKRNSKATIVRLLLCDRLEVDRARDLLKSASIEHQNSSWVLLKRATLALEIGRPDETVACGLQVLHEIECPLVPTCCGLLGRALLTKGKASQALRLLELASAAPTRTEDDVLALARARIQLEKAQVVEALIDAWRLAPEGSAVEAEARRLLSKCPSLDPYTCRSCSGHGRVPSVGGGDFVRTTYVVCRQCLGLGLWHH